MKKARENTRLPADMAASPSRPTCRPSRTRTAVLLCQCAPTLIAGPHIQPQRWVHMVVSGERHESYCRRQVITDRYHYYGTPKGCAARGGRSGRRQDLSLLATAPVTGVDRRTTREDVRNGLTRAVVRAWGM